MRHQQLARVALATLPLVAFLALRAPAAPPSGDVAFDQIDRVTIGSAPRVIDDFRTARRAILHGRRPATEAGTGDPAQDVTIGPFAEASLVGVGTLHRFAFLGDLGRVDDPVRGTATILRPAVPEVDILDLRAKRVRRITGMPARAEIDAFRTAPKRVDEAPGAVLTLPSPTPARIAGATRHGYAIRVVRGRRDATLVVYVDDDFAARTGAFDLVSRTRDGAVDPSTTDARLSLSASRTESVHGGGSAPHASPDSLAFASAASVTTSLRGDLRHLDASRAADAALFRIPSGFRIDEVVPSGEPASAPPFASAAPHATAAAPTMMPSPAS